MTGWCGGSPAIDPLLVTRFAAALDRLNPAGGAIGLAVSGGPDSMALLLLAHAAIPGRFAVATVNHGLRPAAADECALVAAACAARGIDCAALRVTVAPGNVQQQARLARYRKLSEWAGSQGLAQVATAHHADDQAETLLMRLNRGSGVAGLAGVRERGAIGGCALIRPLLGFRRAELATIVAEAGVAVAHDPGNEDDRFDRARIRKALADAHWLDPLALARSAAHLADADAALDDFAQRLRGELVVCGGSAIRLKPAGPRAVLLRLVARIIADIGTGARGAEIARLVERLQAGEAGNLGGVLASVEGAEWLFRPEPPRRA